MQLSRSSSVGYQSLSCDWTVRKAQPCKLPFYGGGGGRWPLGILQATHWFAESSQRKDYRVIIVDRHSSESSVLFQYPESFVDQQMTSLPLNYVKHENYCCMNYNDKNVKISQCQTNSNNINIHYHFYEHWTLGWSARLAPTAKYYSQSKKKLSSVICAQKS